MLDYNLLFCSPVKSFVELVRYLFNKSSANCFLSEHLSQDPLENFFGCQRQRGKTNENPNFKEFCKNTQALQVINSACGTVPGGNCCGSKKNLTLMQRVNHFPNDDESTSS